MPDITNPEAVKFANEKGRVFADALLIAIRTAAAFKREYDANALDALFPNTLDLVADGSDIDGRHRVSGQRMRELYSTASDIVAWSLVGTPTREDRLNNIAVNAQPRY